MSTETGRCVGAGEIDVGALRGQDRGPRSWPSETNRRKQPPARNQARTPKNDGWRRTSTRVRNWKRFGPYLSERQWGTVREDYSADGDAWGYFPHDQARSRAYRWGEDGLLGLCDRAGAPLLRARALERRDPILKERLFGLTGPEGNHGEDVKEHYFYLDATPTHSYGKALYKYPQRAFPYARLVRGEPAARARRPRVRAGRHRRLRRRPLLRRHASSTPRPRPTTSCIAITVANRGPDGGAAARAADALVPQHLVVGARGRGVPAPRRKPSLARGRTGRDRRRAPDAGPVSLRRSRPAGRRAAPELLFTENETNAERLFGAPNAHAATCKDAFHDYVVDGSAPTR